MNRVQEILIMNLKDGVNGPSWDYIPDDLWRYIVRGFLVEFCDSFSLDCIEGKDELESVAPFSEFQPGYEGQKNYQPFHASQEVENSSNYQVSHPSFSFNSYVGELIATVEFGSWHVSNESTPADELIFWQGDSEKVLAVPYEGMIFFTNLRAKERDLLLSIDDRIAQNIRYA